MTIIVAQPCSTYYLWQLEVQLRSFRRLGVEADVIYLFSYDRVITKQAQEFVKSTTASCYFYKDLRMDKIYPPSIVFYLLAKFFAQHGERPFISMDADCLMLQKPSLAVMQENKVYLANTKSDYLSSKYIISKSEALFVRMCLAADITPKEVVANDAHSGGAQYYFKTRLSSYFWSSVEALAVRLYKLMEETKTQYSPAHPIQSWTAGMWALMWELWRMDLQTEQHKELSFTWPSSPVKEWFQNNFYHNAGVVPEMSKDYFYKSAYINHAPKDLALGNLKPTVCSINYAKEVAQTWL